MTTIVYLHGFRSSPASEKAQAMREAVDALPRERDIELWIPDLDASPRIAVNGVVQWVEQTRGADAARITFVGSSLGGFYATWLAERLGARAVLVNPATQPYDDLRDYLGMQTNLYTGRRFEVTHAHFDELRAFDVAVIADPSRYLLYVQSADELLDWRVAVARYGGAWQCIEGGGDHGFAGFERHIPTILDFACNGFHRSTRRSDDASKRHTQASVEDKNTP